MAEQNTEQHRNLVKEDKVLKITCEGCGGRTDVFEEAGKVVTEFFPAKSSGDKSTGKKKSFLFEMLDKIEGSFSSK